LQKTQWKDITSNSQHKSTSSVSCTPATHQSFTLKVCLNCDHRRYNNANRSICVGLPEEGRLTIDAGKFNNILCEKRIPKPSKSLKLKGIVGSHIRIQPTLTSYGLTTNHTYIISGHFPLRNYLKFPKKQLSLSLNGKPQA